MEEKKNLLTYAGPKKLEEELHDLKVVKRKEVAEKIKEDVKKLPVRSKKQENRATFQRMQNTMQQKMSREISKHVSKKSKKF